MKQFLYLLLILPLFSCGGIKANKKSNKGDLSTEKAQSSTQELPSGIVLQYYKDQSGPVADEGGVLYLNIVNKVGDSVLYDSKAMMKEPIEVPISAPRYNGDVMEVFALLSKGDSVLATIPADSFFRGNIPPFIESGSDVYMVIDVVDLKTKDQIEQERADYEANQQSKDDAVLEDYFKKQGIKATKSDKGYYYTVEKQGSGPQPKSGEAVTVNYTGKSLDGKVFDSNVDPQFQHVEPFTFTVGVGQVIPGWDYALSDMKAGDKRVVYIPSFLAYGQNPPPGAPIQKDENLVFEIELLKIGQ